jgi:hypothetical protein
MKKRWTPEEIDYIRANYGRMTIRAIADYLGRTHASVGAYADKRKLGKPVKPWTEEEEEYMATWYGKKSSWQIARHLGRTSGSVRKRAQMRGLSVNNQYKAKETILFGKVMNVTEIRDWMGENMDYVLSRACLLDRLRLGKTDWDLLAAPNIANCKPENRPEIFVITALYEWKRSPELKAYCGPRRKILPVAYRYMEAA